MTSVETTTRTADLCALLATRLGLDPATVVPEARLADLGLDSLDVLESAVVIEQRCGVAIPEETFTTLETVGDLLAVIEAVAPAREEPVS